MGNLILTDKPFRTDKPIPTLTLTGYGQ